MPKDNLDYWQLCDANTRLSAFDHYMFEYKKGKEDDYSVQNIIGIEKDKQEDFEQFKEFFNPI